jgi:hypothetical protein
MAATYVLQGSANWDVSHWHVGGVDADPALPVAGDTLDLGAYILTMNVAALPAGGGVFAEIKSTGVGSVAIALDSATFHDGASLGVTKLTTGTENLISVTGTTDHVLTITGSGTWTAALAGATSKSAVRFNSAGGSLIILGSPTIIGGSATTCSGLTNITTGTITATANFVGGSTTENFGLYNVSTGAVTIIGNVTGGSGPRCPGICNYVAGVLTINRGNLIWSSTNVAITGKFVYNPGPANYISIPNTAGTALIYSMINRGAAPVNFVR